MSWLKKESHIVAPNGVEDEARRHLKVVGFDTITPRTVSWLWPGRWESGSLNVLAGDPGCGKTFLAIDAAARVSTGAAWPDGEPNQRGSVLLLSGEDDPSTVTVNRLRACGADLSKVKNVPGVEVRGEDGERHVDIATDLGLVGEVVRELGDVRLIVVDPVDAYLGAVDSHKKAEVQNVLNKLNRFAQDHRLAALAVAHLNKGNPSAGTKAIYRVMGSLGFISVARTAWLVERAKDDPERRIFASMKMSHGKEPNALAYKLAESPTVPGAAYVDWEPDPIDMQADDALGERSGSQRDEAARFLIEVLRNGPLPAREVIAQGDDAGFSKSTLHRAKEAASVAILQDRDPDTNEICGWVWKCMR